MKLATLLRRSAAAEPTTDLDETAALRRTWDQLRGNATSDAERHEIDALFSRVMP